MAFGTIVIDMDGFEQVTNITMINNKVLFLVHRVYIIQYFFQLSNMSTIMNEHFSLVW